jgi:phage/plasmid-associated DNA primase
MAYHPAEVQQKLNESIDWKNEITTGYLSDIFKLVFGDRFFFQENVFYCYNGVYWEKDNRQNSIINNFIDKDYYKMLIDNILDYEKIFMDDAIESGMEKTLIKAHTELISKQKKNLLSLISINYREGLVKDVKNKLYRDDIIFDINPYLFAFKNKIFDISLNEFVEPKPEYYICQTTGYNYYEDKNKKALMKELNVLIDSIFPDKHIKKLYLTILSTGLSGIPLEKFVISNGSGGNGKGLLNELVQHTIGEYAYVLPSIILLHPIKVGGNPETANLNNKRLVISREPDAKFKFNCSTIKELVGGNEINARTLYSDKTTTNLKMTFVMECNEKPKLNETSDALSRRIIDIPFKSRFVDKKIFDKLNDDQRINVSIINPFFKTREFKDKYRIILFEILRDYFKIYKDNSSILPITDDIIERNEDYMKNCDEMFCWFDENYIYSNNEEDIIQLKEVYDIYKMSDIYINSSKEVKRLFSYKNFIKGIENNTFLKPYIRKSSTGVYIMIKMKKNEEDNSMISQIIDKMEEEDIINTEEEEKQEKIKEQILIEKIERKQERKRPILKKEYSNNYNVLDEGISVKF